MSINNLNTYDVQRRAFLKRLSAMSAMGAAAPLAMNLAAVGEAAAFDSTDYKALVCIFLYGGNDHANTVVPYDLTNYDRYSAIRGGGAGRSAAGIAFGRDQLTPNALTPLVSQTLTDDLQFALAPGLTALKPLWSAGQLAIQLNVGPLVVPLTLAQYNSSNRVANPLPPRLFSHNDQQSVWQSSSPEGSTSGWGGRMGDLFAAGNGNATFTCVSVAGNAVYLSGQSAVQYQVTTSGSVPLSALKTPLFGSQACSDALKKLVTAPGSHLFEAEHARVMKRSIEADATLTSALAGTTPLRTVFPTGNSLASQLAMVARMISARTALTAKRQVFFVSLGGFDTHDGILTEHPALMATVGQALAAFQAATVELGVADSVTAFTASDFGRTLSSNGNGSDHGWGGHHFVMGGAVQGGRYFGTAPHTSIATDDQVGQGRLLPSTSVDQYAATLARWFGVSATEMPSIFPNVGNFATADVGFMG